MADQKPVNITTEEWMQTPLSIRTLVTQSANHIEHLEAQIEKATRHPKGSLPLLEALPSNNEETLVGHILVVDDNEMNRDMLSRRLDRQGHTVDTAVDGRQALDMIKSRNFDLVLLDIMMPEMNGYEVLEALRADESLSYVPVIMISAVDEIDSIVRCVELGAEDYLPKPFNRVLLKARIGASLEKKRLRDRQEAYTHQLNIENQRKTEELERARQIQLSMLPAASPNFLHLDFAARQETASEVGGDYYDFFPLPNGKLLLAIGDATGHGVGSGLMVSMTKASLLAANETDLVALANKINHILNEIDLGLQLNMALLLLEISEMKDDVITIRACGGGMPPIYILRADGSFEEIIVSNLPLGIVDEIYYAATEFKLTSGDAVILSSDGLVERFDHHHKLLGFDQLGEALMRINISGLTASEILARVYQISHDWANGQPLYDDATLVVMRAK